jgi:hypothetical protein
LLDRGLGASEERAAENQTGQTEVPECPRHVSPHVSAESAVEGSGYAILPHRLSSVAIGALLEGKGTEARNVELISPANTARKPLSSPLCLSRRRSAI